MTDEEIHSLAEVAAEKAATKAAKVAETMAARAADNAVGFYYEKTKHDIGLVLEATDFIKKRLDEMTTIDEHNKLKTGVKTMRRALTATAQ